jgi:hypothetical protein
MNKEDLSTCDGAYWYFTTRKNDKEENVIQNTDFYKFNNKKKIEPTECGYIYNILLLRKDEVEYTKAVIGDAKGYIERMGKIGYSGLLVKDQVIPKKTIRSMIRRVLETISHPEKEIKLLLQQV